MSSMDSRVWGLTPQMVTLFGKVIEPLRDRVAGGCMLMGVGFQGI